MNTLLLMVITNAAPMLLPDNEVTEAPVEQLSLRQLETERVRLSDAPSVTGWFTMMGFGLPLAIGGGILTDYTVRETHRAYGWSIVLWGMADFFTVAVTVIGSAMTIASAVMLPLQFKRRDRYEARLAQVRARMTAVQNGEAEAPYDEVPPEAMEVRDRRPGLGLPLGLMAGGLGVGLFTLYDLFRGNGTSWLQQEGQPYLLIAAIVTAVMLEGVGTTLLIQRLRERQEAGEPGNVPPVFAPPPVANKLPPAPTLLSYSWAI